MSRSLLPALPAVLCLALLGAPSGAPAATFCVGAPARCTGTPAATVQEGLDLAAAAPGRDRVEFSNEPDVRTGGFTIAAGNAVDLVGVALPFVNLDAGDTITMDEPSAVASGFSVQVLGSPSSPPVDLAAGTISDVTFLSVTTAPMVRLGDATLCYARFSSYASHSGVAIRAVGPGGLIDRSVVEASTPLESSSDALVVNRGELRGKGDMPGQPAMRVTAGSVHLEDTIISVAGHETGTVGLDVAPGAGSATVAMEGVTVVGPDQPPLSTGVRAACTGGGTASVTFTDSLAIGFGTDLERAAPGCTMDLDHVRYGTRDAGGGSFGDGPAVTSGPVGTLTYGTTPGFDSPLIDAGTPGPSSNVGNGIFGDRVVDGDGDGAAVRDIGAVEYQRVRPNAELAVAPEVETGRDTLLDAHRSEDPDPGDNGRLSFTWTVDGTAVPADPALDQLSHTFPTAGGHTASVTVTDPTGLQRTATATFHAVTTAPAPGLEPPPSSTPLPTPMPPAAIAPQLPAVPAPVLARLLSTRVAGRALRVRVTCRPRLCTGTIVLRAASGRGTVRLGSVKYRVAHGAPRTLKVALGTTALRAIARAGRKGALVSVEIHGTKQAWTSGEGGRVRP